MFNTTPVAQTQAGGWGNTANGFLSGALDVWKQVEQVKAIKSSSGQDQQQAMYQPAQENSAAIVREAPQVNPNVKIAGMDMNKNILMATVGLLVVAVVYKNVIQ